MELCPCLDKASELGNKFKNLRLNRSKFAKFRDPAYRKSTQAGTAGSGRQSLVSIGKQFPGALSPGIEPCCILAMESIDETRKSFDS